MEKIGVTVARTLRKTWRARGEVTRHKPRNIEEPNPRPEVSEVREIKTVRVGE